jgi:hypothetical protein
MNHDVTTVTTKTKVRVVNVVAVVVEELRQRGGKL